MRRDDFTPITFGSVCSGIEAFSVATAPLGWHAVWLAEIEKFPSAVLAHHYPETPNLGDMTKIAALVRSRAVAAPDVLVGGTPCQAFSIAGLRQSLDDARGQLTLSFVDLANAIDATRLIRGEQPAVIVWENVPGVLSTSDNAFGCFLGALAGEDSPLVPPGRKWSNAGCVFGPQRTVAWRVLDAQYFGVAQRRRRVFVVASARKDFDPVAVLFEFDGVRRDTAPSREAWQEVTGTIGSRTTGGGGLGTDFELGGGFSHIADTLRSTDGGSEVDHVLSGYPQAAAPTLARCVTAGEGRRQDYETCTIVPVLSAPVTRSVERPRGDGLDTLIAGTLNANGKAAGSATQQDAEAGMLIIARSVSLRGRDGGATAELGDDVAGCLRASGGGGDKAHVLAPAHIIAQSPPCSAQLGGPIAFSVKDYGGDAMIDLSPTLRSGNHHHSHANGGQPPAICFAENSRGELRLEGGDGQRTGALSKGGGKPGQGQPVGCIAFSAGDSGNDCGDNISPTLRKGGDGGGNQPAVCITGDITHKLKAEGFDASEGGTGRGQSIVTAFKSGQSEAAGGVFLTKEFAPTLQAQNNGSTATPCVQYGMAVRRLTPRECERLQAFPDDYTLIPYGRVVKIEKLEQDWIKYLLRGGVMTLDQVCQAAADGPRYKALGNSMCVNNMRWIAERINAALSASPDDFTQGHEIARVA